jgi:hypothetical protein
MPEILEGIRRSIYATAVETGVRLFGTARNGTYLVRHLIGAGPNAVERQYTYQCDNDFAEAEFNRLLQMEPDLQWLGELHAHPLGYPLLSARDIRTARDVITGEDECLHPDEFICGVLQRVNGGVRIHAVLFTRQDLKGTEMEVIYDVCEKSA